MEILILCLLLILNWRFSEHYLYILCCMDFTKYLIVATDLSILSSFRELITKKPIQDIDPKSVVSKHNI